jgi:DNA-binding transcriptional ArsR family regulator
MAGDDGFTAVPGVDPEPRELLEFDDPDALVLLTEPQRAAITRLLIDAPATAAQLAEALDVPTTRLYYHLDKLEAAGLVRVVATRQVRGVEERRYRAVAEDYRLDPAVLHASRDEPETMDRVVQALLSGVRADLRGVMSRLDPDDDHDQVILARPHLRLTRERQQEFVRRLKALVEEFGDDEGPHLIGALIAAYPSSAGRRAPAD